MTDQQYSDPEAESAPLTPSAPPLAPTAPAPAPATPEEIEKAAKLDALCKTVAGFIDAFMLSVGIKIPANVTDEQGWRYLQLGTASGRVGVMKEETNAYLYAEAQVMSMPSDKDLILPLMRELLEINLSIAGPVRFGIRDDLVYSSIRYPADGLDEAMVGRCIHSAMAVADTMDEKFNEKYGGTTLRRSEA